MTRAERHKGNSKAQNFHCRLRLHFGSADFTDSVCYKVSVRRQKRLMARMFRKGAAAQRAKSYPMYRARTQRRATLQQGLTAWTQTMSSFCL